ncbi:hypothetical protein [Mycobacterium colombiense]|uniref:hypothetical protein n=1 Tax=Mycobacterium colombiense TaxID=339268 RepID=UPI0008024BC5|nr:hypothetical protein [Mycobacterium colombiense]OBJ18108.1 hypothetical protein A9W93_19840 [Mycobacterium colombiense]
MALPAGSDWPGAVHGEVVSPTGKRAYLTSTIAALLGKSDRWVTGLASSGKIETERGRAVHKQGGERWFLIADSFEAFGTAEKWWPPPPPRESPDGQNWAELIAMQGADLEAARAKVAALEVRCRHLKSDNSRLHEENTELYDIIGRLGRLGGRRASGQPGPEQDKPPG